VYVVPLLDMPPLPPPLGRRVVVSPHFLKYAFEVPLDVPVNLFHRDVAAPAIAVAVQFFSPEQFVTTGVAAIEQSPCHARLND
jgi:hypothetical protein